MENLRDLLRRISERKEEQAIQVRAKRENIYSLHFQKLLEITASAMREENLGNIQVSKNPNQASVPEGSIRLLITTTEEDFNLFDELVTKTAVVFFENHKRAGEKDREIYPKLKDIMRASCALIAHEQQEA
ncbi:MAG: hypothetical protein M1524_02885 [Patescibacteria group bacterium]|nr:hypothetical protein [Patescibacteria group bacterium]